ncbi:MAG: branched-chain amino acid aminotransferase [Rhodospirillaceae bacterium]|nr:branched-chain amino acid aminotransferase [Rhodospirillaceae bacterium]
MSATPYDDRDGQIWFDGEMVPWRDAKVHLLTHALHYASSVFEGVRMYNGNIFKLTEHSERLHNSAKILGFEIPWTTDQINQACMDACEINGIKDGYIRPVAWRGSEMMGVSAQKNTIHLAVAAWEWPSYFSPEARMRGIRLQTSKWKRPSAETEPVHSKAAGLYMICTLSKHAAEQAGFDDSLMLDYRGQVAEATGANIFMEMGDGKLHTPIPDCFLDGITRRTIIELAKKRGIDVVERVIMPDELANATQVFLTGTAAEVTPVGAIDSHTYTVGEITKQMMNDYDKAVGKSPANASAA